MSRHRKTEAGVEDPSPPLVCTADDGLLDVTLGWCSAVGAQPEVVVDAGLARRRWRSARFIVVGADQADELARSGIPKRHGVFIATVAGQAKPWTTALALGAADILDGSDSHRALEALTAAVDGPGEACVVAVIGGTGGAGASTLTAALAVEAARRRQRTLLIDGDPLGGGLDLLMGLEDAAGLRWPDLGTRDGPLTAGSLADALPAGDGVSVLSWGREGTNADVPVSSVLTAAMRGFDLVACDLGRHPDSFGSELLRRALLTVVVVPEEVRAVSAASRVIMRLRDVSTSLAVVSAARRPGLSREAMAEVLGVPVVARWRPDARLRGSVDHGAGLGGSAVLRRSVGPVLDLVGIA